MMLLAIPTSHHLPSSSRLTLLALVAWLHKNTGVMPCCPMLHCCYATWAPLLQNGSNMSQRLPEGRRISDARALQAGGFVAEGRVNGSLNLSRALGDHEYKQARVHSIRLTTK